MPNLRVERWQTLSTRELGRPGRPDRSLGNNRDQLIYGTYWPGLTPDTVGLLSPPEGLTPVYTNAVYQGQLGTSFPYISLGAGTYTNKFFWGQIRPTGDVTFQNCVFAGTDPILSEDLRINTANNNSSVTIQGLIRNYGTGNIPLIKAFDCLFDPTFWLTDFVGRPLANGTVRSLSPMQVGLHGANLWAERTEMRGTQDIINYVGRNSQPQILKLFACWLHDNHYQSGWYKLGSPNDHSTHSDSIQANTGGYWEIKHCVIGGWRNVSNMLTPPQSIITPDANNALVMLQQEVNGTDADLKVKNILFEENLWIGSSTGWNIANKNGNLLTENVNFYKNRFVQRQSNWNGLQFRDDGPPGAEYYMQQSSGRYALIPVAMSWPTIAPTTGTNANTIWAWNRTTDPTGANMVYVGPLTISNGG